MYKQKLLFFLMLLTAFTKSYSAAAAGAGAGVAAPADVKAVATAGSGAGASGSIKKLAAKLQAKKKEKTEESQKKLLITSVAVKWLNTVTLRTVTASIVGTDKFVSRNYKPAPASMQFSEDEYFVFVRNDYALVESNWTKNMHIADNKTWNDLRRILWWKEDIRQSFTKRFHADTIKEPLSLNQPDYSVTEDYDFAMAQIRSNELSKMMGSLWAM